MALVARAGVGDDLEEAVVGERLVDLEGSHQKARRSLQADRVGDREVAFERPVISAPLVFTSASGGYMSRPDLRKASIIFLRDPVSRNAHQGMMNGEIFALIFRASASCAPKWTLAQNWPILVDEPHLAVGLYDALEMGAAALQYGQL